MNMIQSGMRALDDQEVLLVSGGTEAQVNGMVDQAHKVDLVPDHSIIQDPNYAFADTNGNGLYDHVYRTNPTTGATEVSTDGTTWTTSPETVGDMTVDWWATRIPSNTSK